MQLSFSKLAFLTLIAIPVLTNAQNQFNSPNEFVCNGQKVEMTCYIEPPTSDDFSGSVPDISFNDSIPYGQDAIDSNSIQGIDTSRYTIQYLEVELPRLACTIIISSYLPQDAATVFGCYGKYSNGTNTVALASGNGPQPVKPPSKISIPFSNIISIGAYCIADVSIDFSPPYSYSRINNYNLYVDGNFNQKLDSSSSTVSLLLSLATRYELTITADNCGGTSALSDVTTISTPSYRLDNNLAISLDYLNNLVIQWSLTDAYATGLSIPISYRLKVDSAFTYDETSSVLNQSINFQQTSSKSSYSSDLGLSITGEKKVTLDTIVKLTITSQCNDKAFAGNSVSGRETGLKSNVHIINIPYNISWIVLAVFIILTVGCTASNVVLVLYTLNEYSKKRSIRRRNAYLNLVPRGGNEASAPLLNPPSYAVNTEGIM